MKGFYILFKSFTGGQMVVKNDWFLTMTIP